ncbi:TonB-dependent receptor [Arenibacter sp. N53]|uniref:SusC/RagA family TonB-linked outer membrane protein n=1 Tax=Arenibacter TaxID=178469 RepID=UPI000CD3BBF2|nr:MULTISPECIES: TonB-dependent receptor [Arenibacter]MCM4151734.1 TonB-dependent receptor [Arenibacter sp. N53]
MMLKLKFLIITLVLVCSQNVVSQTKNITGLVSDESGLPLPGVTVVVKGTVNGTTTDFDGNYSIGNVGPEDRLVFTYIGMVSQTITVGQQTTIKVTLLESYESLEEVVVVGYGVQKKALTTGANLNVKGEDIAELNTSTAMEALQGVAPGVSVTRNNGEPGAGTKVTIRGLGTIGNSSPLYIVDGVAVGNIDYLNSSDIESIDVLKDAASAAIYGSRAANGVVLVTTHKGRKGSKAQIQYDSYYGIQKIYKNLSPLNAQEYMFIMDEGRVNDGLEPNNWEAILQNNNWLNNNYPNNLGTELGSEIWGMLQNGWEGTNWIDEMTTKSAPVTSHSVNITGGGEDSTYAFGVSYLDQTGIIGGNIIDAGYKRLTARMNTEFVLFKNDDHSILTIGENLTYTNSEYRGVATGNIYWNDLHNALVQNPLMPAYWDKSPDANGFTPTLDGLANDQANPLAVMFYRSNYSNLGNKDNTLVGNVYMELEPIEDLKFRSSYGLDSWFGHGRSWTPTFALGVLFSNANDGASQYQYLGANLTWTNTLTYERTFGNHNINALIGNEVYKNQINNSVGGSMANTRFGLPEYAYLNNVDKTDVNSINTFGADYAAGGGGLLSYIARAQYDYKEKYLLSATMRADGSSNFAKGNRWGYFPSVSAGWILTNEDFLSNNSGVLDFAKFRGSWGQNGNQSIDNFIYSSNIAYLNPGYYFGDTKPISGATAVPARVTNPDVTWETSEQLNFGLDARFFNSRLDFTADWYKKTTKDWLVVAPIQGTSGAGAPYINGGDIENTGYELMLSWNDNIGDFKYGATISGAFNKNEITKIANSDGIIQGPSSVLSQGTASVSRAEVGKPIGFFYGYETDGILQTQDEVDAYVKPTDGTPYFSDQRPGDVRFVDQNQDGIIDESDKKMLGNPNPDFELGIQLNAEYKGFYANVTLSGKYGMQVMQSYRSFADRFDQNYTTEIFGRWHGAGTSNTLPRLSSVSNRNTNWISDIYMQDADYLRINNLTVGVKLGDYISDIKLFSDIKVYVAINNLYTFTNFKGMDPEVSFGHDAGWASGIDLGLYPLPRTVMFGFSVDF